MIAIFKREIQSFFTSPIGYLVIGLFLVLNGLFLWVFKGPFNIFECGFADLGNFFLLAPWVFLFLIPAITMKSFSEEKKLGTLELLFIKPISLWETVIGKFLGTFCLALIAILPTLLYVYTISQLGVTILPTGPMILFVEQIGMKAHFESIARGVLDTRDIIYFTSLTLFFLYLTINQLKNQNR